MNKKTGISSKEPTLFGEQPMFCKRVYTRDVNGRFASILTAKLQRSEHEAKYYKMMYESEISRSKGFADMLRLKEEEIINLKNKLGRLHR